MNLYLTKVFVLSAFHKFQIPTDSSIDKLILGLINVGQFGVLEHERHLSLYTVQLSQPWRDKPIFSIVVLVALLSLACTKEDSTYTTKYDNVDLADLVKNDRLLKNYVDCLLEKASCTPDGLELRKNMPDAIETDCSKCSEKQREGSDYIIKFLIDNKPDYWTLLEEKYDPTGSYKAKYLSDKKMSME
ncbi:unnamed protein product [Brassicogethes aeneus]|uniref:Uncharacterized protein n=1 Tax=Brassicogethes aeneus TaxID=1431903 RepID=A0A9P0AQM8_BRAAE|nr:unnamed protein product [Brassicogethes aeneus]